VSTDTPIVGLVVPDGIEHDENYGMDAPLDVALRSTLSDDGKTLTLPAGQRRTRGPGKGHKSEATLDLGFAIQALQTAREGADALQADMLPHQREKVLIDPRSQLEHAKRLIDQVLARWERGGR